MEDATMNPEKRIGLCLVYIAILAASALGIGNGTWVPLSSLPEGSPPEVTILDATDSRTVIRMDLPGYYVEEIEADGATYQLPQLPEEGMMTDIGNPELPVITRWIIVPNTGSIEVDVLREDHQQIPGVFACLPRRSLLRPDTRVGGRTLQYVRADRARREPSPRRRDRRHQPLCAQIGFP